MANKKFYQTMFAHSFNIPVRVHYWDDTEEVYGDGDPIVTVTIKNAPTIPQLVKNASLALGEAYMRGDIDVKGDVPFPLQTLLTAAYESAGSFMRSSKLRHWLPKQSHSERESKKDIHSHYDLGNDFYELWLDPTMTYSCAYFENPEDDLETAQMQKIDHILRKLNPQPGRTLLDIGCGWGTLMLRAATTYHLKVVGITLSREQFKFVSARIKELHLEDQAEVLYMDYREMDREPFDYVTSVGMFEHVGKENLGTYFQDVSRLLKDDGVALIHGITRQQGGAYNAWINRYIFPGGYIPGMTENLDHIIAADLQIDDIEPLRRHYQHTLELWDTNFNNKRNTVQRQFGYEFVRMWDLYLQAAAASFESGNIDVMQFLMSKGASSKDLPMTRDYIYE